MTSWNSTDSPVPTLVPYSFADRNITSLQYQPSFPKAVATRALVSEDDDHLDKIVGVVVPFACVILLAAVVFLTFKLCQRYGHHGDGESGKGLRLHKYLTLCDNCFSTQHVFDCSDAEKGQGHRTSTASITAAQWSHTHSLRSDTPSSPTRTCSTLPASPRQDRVPRGPKVSKSPLRHSFPGCKTSSIRPLSPTSMRQSQPRRVLSQDSGVRAHPELTFLTSSGRSVGRTTRQPNRSVSLPIPVPSRAPVLRQNSAPQARSAPPARELSHSYTPGRLSQSAGHNKPKSRLQYAFHSTPYV